MKKFLLAIFFISTVNLAFGQLESGTKFTTDLVLTDILTGNTIDVQAELASGKTVVLDIFATWCGPCLAMKNNGILERLHETYGPNGTDQMVIIGIEADERTAESLLYEEAYGGSQATTSLTNWTEGVEYALANDDSFNTELAVRFYPSIYIIQPDQTLIYNTRFRNDDEAYAKFGFGTENDAGLLGGFGSSTYCGSTYEFNGGFLVQNFSGETISEAIVEVYLNDALTDTYSVTDLAPYAEVILATGSYSTDIPDSKIKLALTTVNGVADVADSFSETFEATNYQRTFNTQKFTVLFTTDFWVAETGLKITDADGNIYVAESFDGDANAGGGADANQTFEYQLELDSAGDINCVNIEITDTYGDGLRSFNPSTDPTPGVVVLDGFGNEVKELLDIDYNFGTLNNLFVEFGGLSSINDLTEEESIEVYPNPVTDLVNVDFNVSTKSNVTVRVTNSLGQNVLVQNLGNNSGRFIEKLDVTNLDNGIYNMYIKLDDREVVKRFVKQ